MRKLQQHASSTPPDVLLVFKTQHDRDLERLADALLPDHRSAHDAFFNLIQWRRARSPKRVTLMFEQFIQGITYFDDQPLSSRPPVYHRLFSCGTGRQAFRQTYLQCRDDGSMSKPDRQRTQKQIETCYIERLVYDELFKHDNLHFPAVNEAETPQDDGHLYFLSQTRDDFQSCFPHMDLRVHVDFDGDVPVRLEISKTTHGKHTSTAIYIKESLGMQSFGKVEYDPFVRCFQINASGATMTRIQTFQRLPRPWKPVAADAAVTMIPTPHTHGQTHASLYRPLWACGRRRVCANAPKT
jgi:hypothetical protein